MSEPLTIQFAALTVLVGVAAFVDLRSRRIPNLLTAGGVLVGLVLAAVQVQGLPTGAIAAVLMALAVGFPLFAFGVLGAGDAKLLAAVAAFVGPAGLPLVLLYSGAAGGLLAVASAVKGGAILPLLLNVYSVGLCLVTLGRQGEWRTLATPQATTVPYGVAIAVGAVAACLYPLGVT